MNQHNTKLKRYIQQHFPGIYLQPPLFYNADIGIRFELGNPAEENIELYLTGAHKRAVALFHTIFAPEDPLFVVVNVHQWIRDPFRTQNLFRKYVTNPALRYRCEHVIWHRDEEILTHQFSVLCKASELRAAFLLKKIVENDFSPIGKSYHPSEFYFVHAKQGSIFYVYDDRGCDVVATSVEYLRDLYKRHEDWVLDYDRATILQKLGME
jgi:hypothetical protein